MQGMSRLIEDRVFHAMLEKARFPDQYFDVVTLWQVLEHARRPALLFREVRRILKRDGIVYLALPNFASLEFMLFRTKWFNLDVPRHLYHYTPKTIERLAERNGLKVVIIDYLELAYNSFGLFQTLFNLFCEHNFF